MQMNPYTSSRRCPRHLFLIAASTRTANGGGLGRSKFHAEQFPIGKSCTFTRFPPVLLFLLFLPIISTPRNFLDIP